jgi:hypothetical protein
MELHEEENAMSNIAQLRELLTDDSKLEKAQAEETVRREGTVTRFTAATAKNQLQAITPRHRAIMRACLKGMTVGEIAEITGLSPKAVSMIVNSEIFKRELANLQDRADEKCIEGVADVRKTIEELSGVSMAVLNNMLRDNLTNPKLRADIAWDILDRAGHGAVQKSEIKHDWAHAVTGAFAKRKAAKAAIDAASETIVIENIPRTIEAAADDAAQKSSDGESSATE